jgi:hypothetical protein
MTYEKFEQIFSFLYNQNKAQNAWVDKLPHDISSAFFDNEYVNSISLSKEMLLDNLFEDQFLRYDIDYILYNEARYIINGDIEWKFDNSSELEEFLEYFKEVYFTESSN